MTIVGIALSPEFIYAVGPSDIMPDDRRFGLIWMSEKALASVPLAGSVLKIIQESEGVVQAGAPLIETRQGGGDGPRSERATSWSFHAPVDGHRTPVRELRRDALSLFCHHSIDPGQQRRDL
ncbi:hypothetical protein NKH48_12495 [Mesorhizobium sp. M1233]|uniref:hypothetical protein n=1 Tax=Mesorhizobium sp. M1233 TaxID=2957072 RepID=UPI003338D141